MSKVIESMGGDDAFIRRLDASFLPGLGADRGENNNAGTAIYNPGNEPSFLIPFLYNYVPGHHWKTANQTRAIVDEFCAYNSSRVNSTVLCVLTGHVQIMTDETGILATQTQVPSLRGWSSTSSAFTQWWDSHCTCWERRASQSSA